MNAQNLRFKQLLYGAMFCSLFALFCPGFTASNVSARRAPADLALYASFLNRIYQFDRARSYADEALLQSHTFVPALIEKNVADLRTRHFDAAQLDNNRILKSQPKNAYGLYLKGFQLASAGNYKEAQRMAAQAHSIDPNTIEITVFWETCNRASSAAAEKKSLDFFRYFHDRFEQSMLEPDPETALTKAIKKSPNNEVLYLMRARHRVKNDMHGAIEDYSYIIAKHPDLYELFLARGFLFESEHDLRRALSDYSAAVMLSPNTFEPHMRRAELSNKCNRYQEAIADLNKALELQPHNALAYKNRGDAYSFAGDHRHALADYEQAGTLDPELASAFEGQRKERQILKR